MEKDRSKYEKTDSVLVPRTTGGVAERVAKSGEDLLIKDLSAVVGDTDNDSDPSTINYDDDDDDRSSQRRSKLRSVRAHQTPH